MWNSNLHLQNKLSMTGQVNTHTHTHTHMCTHRHTHTHTHTQTHMNTQRNTPPPHANTHACVHTHTHMHAHIQLQTLLILYMFHYFSPTICSYLYHHYKVCINQWLRLALYIYIIYDILKEKKSAISLTYQLLFCSSGSTKTTKIQHSERNHVCMHGCVWVRA